MWFDETNYLFNPSSTVPFKLQDRGVLVYEVIGFIILFIIAYFWYGHFLKTTEFILVSFAIAVVYYMAFHWIVGTYEC